MPNIEDQLRKKKPFKKKAARSYLGLGETLDDLSETSAQEHTNSVGKEPLLQSTKRETVASSLSVPTEDSKVRSEIAIESTDSKLVADQEQSSSTETKVFIECLRTDSDLESTEVLLKEPNAFNSASIAGCTPTPSCSEITPKWEQTDSKLEAKYKQINSNVVAKYKQISSTSEEVNGQKRQERSLIEETDSKAVANKEQSSSIHWKVNVQPHTNSKLVAKCEQSASNLESDHEQTNSSDAQIAGLTNSKAVAKPIAEVEAIQEQSTSKLIAKVAFAKLSGIQRTVALLIYEECKRVRSKITDEISILDVTRVTQADTNTTKNAINRLIQKAVIARFEFKDGRAGWTRYELADSIYQEIREREFSGRLVANWEQTRSKVIAEPVAQLIASAPSSSSSSSSSSKELNTTTSEALPQSNELPPDWEEVDYTALHDMKVYLGKDRIRQIYSKKWCKTSQDLQESIDHFAFFMAHVRPDKAPKQPVNFFMAAMRDGHYFGRPDGYLSPEEKAEQARLAAEEKKASNIAFFQQRRFDAIFEQWFANLRKKEIDLLTTHVDQHDYETKKNVMKHYFRDYFWLDFRDNPSLDVTKLRLPQFDELQVNPASETASLEFDTALADIDHRTHPNFHVVPIEQISET